MAVKEPPPPGLLDSFSNPVWERVRLDDPKPLWIVQSSHRGYKWMAIELEHRSEGLFSDGASSTDTTTVFVVRLPEKSGDWFLPASRITAHRQVCVDDECVYVAAVGQSPRVRDWPRWLDTAADAADEVIGNRGKKAHPPRGDDGAADDDEKSWNPHDGRWVLFWMMITVPAAFMLAMLLMVFYKEWAGTGAVSHCDKLAHLGYQLQGWKAKAYLGLFIVPFIGWGRLLHTVSTRMHKPGFVLRLNLEGAALAALSVLALFLQQTLTGWARTAC
ncbi:hypothetical protein PMI14_06665 [Acidovorax sp. CF316]|uniref:hypothetical protein n=1 Tax=Acidovorax sp. CF316 TaxID=1144317 RepID=UPI00026BD867|nr:hypothetical protein [Acidovorax sp. CF316]EJE48902.1 hypothetical protein PMI14_06665 [Acidovorax sp. CF316]